MPEINAPHDNEGNKSSKIRTMLGIVGTMAAYALGPKLLRGVAGKLNKVGGRVLGKMVKSFTGEAKSRFVTALKKDVSSFLSSKSSKVSVNRIKRSITSKAKNLQKLYNSASKRLPLGRSPTLSQVFKQSRFYKNVITPVSKFARSKTPRSKLGKFAFNLAKGEASVMPIMYLQHKAEQRNIAEENRKGFVKTYASTYLPMSVLFSAGIPLAGSTAKKLGKGTLGLIDKRKAGKLLEKTLGFLHKTTRKVTSVTTPFSKAKQFAKSSTTSTQNTWRNLLTLKKGSVKNITHRTSSWFKSFAEHYRVQRFEHKLEMKLPKEGIRKAFMDKTSLELFEEGLEGSLKVPGSGKQALEHYTSKFKEPTKPMKFMNKLLESLGETEKITFAKRRMKAGGGNLSEVAGTLTEVGKYNLSFKGKTYDIRALDMQFLGKKALSLIGKAKVISKMPAIGRFFGSNVIRNQINDNVITIGGKKGDTIRLGSPIKAAKDISGKYVTSTDDVIESFFGKEGKLSYTDAIVRQERVNLLARGTAVDKMEESLTKRVNEHMNKLAKELFDSGGVLKLKENQLIRQIGNKAELLLKNIDDSGFTPVRLGYNYKLGNYSDINMLAFPTGKHGLLDAYDSLIGRSQISTHKVRRERESVIGNFMERQKEKLELGSTGSVFNKVKGLFTRYKDKDYIPTFFSDEHLFKPKASLLDDIFKDTGDLLNKKGNTKVRSFVETIKAQEESVRKIAYDKVLRDKKARSIINKMINEATDQSIEIEDFILHPGMGKEERLNIYKNFKKFTKNRIEPDEFNVVFNPRNNVVDDISEFLMQADHRAGRNTITIADEYNSKVITHFLSNTNTLNANLNPDNISKRLIENGIIIKGSKEQKIFEGFLAHTSFKKSLDDIDKLTRASNIDVSVAKVKTGIEQIVDNATYNKARLKEAVRITHPVTSFEYTPDKILTGEGNYSAFTLFHKGEGTGFHGGFKPHRETTLINNTGDPINIKSLMDSPVNMSAVQTSSFFRTMNNTMDFLGLGFDTASTRSGYDFMKKLLIKRALPAYAAYKTWGLADSVIDSTGMFDGTPLEEGLTMFVANQYAKTRLAVQSVLDLTGVSDAAKYMENLMPGSIRSPLGGLARGIAPLFGGMALGMRKGGPTGALTGGIIGGSVGMLLGGGPLGLFGAWDIDKSREKIIKEFEGESDVVVRRSRFWELSSSRFEGEEPLYTRPHWYARLKSQYRRAPNYMGGRFEEFLGSYLPGYYNDKHYYSRPYPTSQGVFSNIPLFGKVASFGRSIQHKEDLITAGNRYALEDNTIDGYGFTGSNSPFAGEWTDGDTSLISPGSLELKQADPITKDSLSYKTGEAMYMMTELGGLKGWGTQLAFGTTDIGASRRIMESSDSISSLSRQFWDNLQLGGLAGMSEPIRRFIPNERGEIDTYNPIVNLMPDWLPGPESGYYLDFRTGDPYVSSGIKEGEIRLPGAAYETLRDIDYTFPKEGKAIGLDGGAQIAYFLGDTEFLAKFVRANRKTLGVKEAVLSSLKRSGQVNKLDASVYNPTLDMSARADAVIKGQMGSTALMIRPITDMIPEAANVSELNAFLNLSNISTGMLLNVDVETGNITSSTIRKDTEMFSRDLAQLSSASSTAKAMLAKREREGFPDHHQNAYSRLDRLAILSDVAYNSPEFYRTKKEVDAAMQSGMLSGDQRKKYERIMNNLTTKLDKYNEYEYRFINQGTPVTFEALQRQKDIKREFNIAERTIGGAWEVFSHLRSPIHTKLLGTYSAMEEYERTSIYGKGNKLWDHPVKDFVNPYLRTMAVENNPLQGVVSFATGGFIFGGSSLASVISGTAGGIYAGTRNVLGLERTIPKSREEERDIAATFDAIKYKKNEMLYYQTMDDTYKRRMKNTLTYLNTASIVDDNMIYRASDQPEKKYIREIMKLGTEQERAHALRIMPDLYKGVLSKYWTGSNPNESINMEVPEEEWYGYDQRVDLRDIKLKELKNHALDYHSQGLGFHRQMNKLKNMPEISGLENTNMINIKQDLEIKNTIKDALSSFGSVSIIEDGRKEVTVNIK